MMATSSLPPGSTSDEDGAIYYSHFPRVPACTACVSRHHHVFQPSPSDAGCFRASAGSWRSSTASVGCWRRSSTSWSRMATWTPPLTTRQSRGGRTKRAKRCKRTRNKFMPSVCSSFDGMDARTRGEEGGGSDLGSFSLSASPPQYLVVGKSGDGMGPSRSTFFPAGPVCPETSASDRKQPTPPVRQCADLLVFRGG